MSIIANNVKSENIIALENIASTHSNQIGQLTDLFVNRNKRSYDQTTRQDVIISFINGSYRLEIQKPENDVYMYQVWAKNNTDLNSERIYMNEKLIYWITNIFKNQKNYTPTTMIEIENNFYPAVMVDAKIEHKLVNNVMTDYCVFYFKTNTITYQSDILKKTLPQSGYYTNVRFDIDDATSNTPNPIELIVNLLILPILSSFNIQNSFTIPQNIPPISQSINQYGAVTIDVAASGFSISINDISNNINLNFNRYYGPNIMEYSTKIPCILNIDSMSFTNIRVLLDDYEDVTFNNIKIPFKIDTKILFDNNTIQNSKVYITLDDTNINFPDSILNYWNNYWGDRITNAEVADGAAVAAAVISLGISGGLVAYFSALTVTLNMVKDEFPSKLNQNAGIADKIVSQLPNIENTINSYFTTKTAIDLHDKYKYLIDILTQVNTNPWDFSGLLCTDDSIIYNPSLGGYGIQQCYNNASQKYIFVTTDTPFPNTNFPANQLYIVKSDYSSCYAIDISNSTLTLFNYINTIHISGYEPAAALIRTSDTNGTLALTKPIIFGVYIDTNINTDFISLSTGNSVIVGNASDYMIGTISNNSGFYLGFTVIYNTRLSAAPLTGDTITTVYNPPIIRNYKYIDIKNIEEIETNTIYRYID
jgi:hypothetical protein